MPILITGASGYVGNAVSGVLAANDFEILKVGGKTVKKPFENSDRGIEYRVDIGDDREVSKLAGLQNVSTIIHSAGLAHRTGENLRGEYYRVNVEGTINVCQLAAKLKIERLILISSVAVYGASGGESVKTEKSLCRPNGDYAESKFAAERIAFEMCVRSNVNLTVLRLATVIGEDDRANYFRLIDRINRRKFVRIGNGLNRKSLIYKDDVGRACLKIIESSRSQYEVFNLSAEPLAVREIVAEIMKTLDKKHYPPVVPSVLVGGLKKINAAVLHSSSIRRLTQTAEKLLTEDVFEADLIKKVYGFTPEISAREAVRRECVWYLKANRQS